ncbi:MAG TPA: sulfate ABC transporter substrate-binding protein [Chthoniobacterales bacterium]
MKKSLLLAALVLSAAATLHAETKILNASYDVTREFYNEYNPLFAQYWKDKTGKDVTIDQSNAGSSKQARAVVDGLQADVVTFNQDTDIQLLADNGLVPAGWKTLLPNDSSPYTSTIVFLVRKGNPKGIKDWNDLVKDGASVIIPNPKTSGNGRYSYLGAWAYALKQAGGNADAAKAFVAKLFKNVPVLETGGRAATNTFVQKGFGDVLLTFESEVLQISRVFSPDQFEVVYPSLSILAEPPVAVVAGVVDRNGNREVATEYLKYLWSAPGQELVVKNFYRPRSAELLAKNASLFPPIELFSVDKVFGGWKAAQKEHFADGGVFDQIYAVK